MKKQQLNPPEINNSKTQNKSLKRRGVPGAVCDHILLSLCFDREDSEVELRQYAVARGVLDDRGLPSNVVGSNPTSGFHKKTER